MKTVPVIIVILSAFTLLQACNDKSNQKVIDFNTDEETDSTTGTGSNPDTEWQPDSETFQDTGIDTGTDENDALASGVVINAADVYPAVRIPIMSNGNPLKTSLNLIEGKDALFRLYVSLESPSIARPLAAQVEIIDASDRSLFFIGVPAQVQSPDLDALESSLNVTVPGTAMTPNARVVVSVVEPDGDPLTGDVSAARWPSKGLASLSTTNSAGPFRVLVIPVRYDHDGSGRMPDLSADAQRRLRQKFEAMYPASSVQMDILSPPLAWNHALTADGDGYDRLLEELQSLRQERDAPGDQYYLGLFKTEEVFLDENDDDSFCFYGCVTGLSNLVEAVTDDWARTSIAIGYLDDTDPDWREYHLETILHEVGHANGREHAPSGGAEDENPDPAFPYAEGKIGIQGYDIIKEKLYEPDQHYDLMGYASPQWISDYTYSGLLTRIQDVNTWYSSAKTAAPGGAGDSAVWMTIWLSLDGSARMGAPRVFSTPPGGHVRWIVELLDAADSVITSVEGVFVPFGELSGGQILFRKPDDALFEMVASVRIVERDIQLSVQ